MSAHNYSHEYHLTINYHLLPITIMALVHFYYHPFSFHYCSLSNLLPPLFPRIRGFSHYAAQTKKPLSKLLLRGERRSPLKYIMSIFLSNFEYFIEKMFGLYTRIWISFLVCPNSCQEAKLLVPKMPKSASM